MEWADVSVKGGFSAVGDCRLGPLAQLVEHRTFNPWVVGSIPTGPTLLAKSGKTPGLLATGSRGFLCVTDPSGGTLPFDGLGGLPVDVGADHVAVAVLRLRPVVDAGQVPGVQLDRLVQIQDFLAVSAGGGHFVASDAGTVVLLLVAGSCAVERVERVDLHR